MVIQYFLLYLMVVYIFLDGAYCDSVGAVMENKEVRDKTNSLSDIITTGKLSLTEDFKSSENTDGYSRSRRKKLKKRFEKYILPLIMAYKLKFVALIPLFVGGLILLVGSTGLAGFFFALFAAALGLKASGKDDIYS
ncbi:uncharacterized protein LOC108734500 [Agrilus planipennis]|uniref:Uncharacterized protein LOC108734500 n=1 Tax=Agrilus planipennis TaxID=224129 RepID=A0A1W4WNH9_AGRPL|nr:uncharacterized protein LOC108734500 [Agrilus planipennis]